MFFEDRQSQLAKQAFRQDQKIASDLGISETATAVVFNTEDSDYGLMILQLLRLGTKIIGKHRVLKKTLNYK